MVNISQTLAIVAAAAAVTLACGSHHDGQHDVDQQWEGQYSNEHQWRGHGGQGGHGSGRAQEWRGESPPPPAPPAHHYNPASGVYSPPDYQPPAGSSTPPATSVLPANPSRATHRVTAGFNGLHFEPDNIAAEIGDLIEVHFNPLNHSFAQSSFAKPCVPINDDAIFSGFQPTPSGEAKDVFTIEIQDKLPKWFYCSQTKLSHCQSGMAMVVNQDYNGPNTLAAYKAKAATTEESISPRKPGNGGTLAPPPNGPGS